MNLQSYIGSIEWEPKNSGIIEGYGIGTRDLQQAAPSVSSRGECFYQGYQKGPLSGPKWRIIITTDPLLSGNNLPLNYRGSPITWVLNPKKSCGPKNSIYGYRRQKPFLRIANKISRELGFKRNFIHVSVYSATLNNDTLIILEPSRC